MADILLLWTKILCYREQRIMGHTSQLFSIKSHETLDENVDNTEQM